MLVQRKVIVLTTGGTIGHRSTPEGVAIPEFNPQDLTSAIALPDVTLEFRTIFKKGSKDITPHDWQIMAAAAAQALGERPCGVVLLHGTDTMHYTAAALSFMLQRLSVPVVLTGSMVPGGDPGSDAVPNLRDAVRVAAYADLAEVCIVFSANAARASAWIIRGNRARKIHSQAINAFESVNVPPIGTVKGDDITLEAFRFARQASTRRVMLTTNIEADVPLIKLTPAVTATALKRYLDGVHGAVLEGTGIGHLSNELHDVIRQFAKPTAVTTQVAHGGERLGLYSADSETLALPNIIPTRDMTSETALVKLIWTLGQGGEVASQMVANIAGEIGCAQTAVRTQRRSQALSRE